MSIKRFHKRHLCYFYLSTIQVIPYAFRPQSSCYFAYNVSVVPNSSSSRVGKKTESVKKSAVKHWVKVGAAFFLNGKDDGARNTYNYMEYHILVYIYSNILHEVIR